jgi:hypothetical protein
MTHGRMTHIPRKGGTRLAAQVALGILLGVLLGRLLGAAPVSVDMFAGISSLAVVVAMPGSALRAIKLPLTDVSDTRVAAHERIDRDRRRKRGGTAAAVLRCGDSAHR